MSPELNVADKLWDLGNYVTGFAVAQSLVFIFAMAKDEIKIERPLAGHWACAAGTVLFTAGYLFAIRLCGVEGAVRDASNAPLWRAVTRGREFAVVVFAAVAVAVTYTHWSDYIFRQARHPGDETD